MGTVSGSCSGGPGVNCQAGSGRPSCLAKNVSMTCRAIGAGQVPVLAVLGKDHTGDPRMSFGAKNVNQP